MWPSNYRGRDPLPNAMTFRLIKTLCGRSSATWRVKFELIIEADSNLDGCMGKFP